jgi:hypothetical protein
VLCPRDQTELFLRLTEPRGNRVVTKGRASNRGQIHTVMTEGAMQFKKRRTRARAYQTAAAERISALGEQWGGVADQATREALRALDGVLSARV